MVWIYGIWFVSGANQDWMGTLLKKDDKWVFEYRFRYYNKDSNDPFDKKDQKSWYGVKSKDDSQESFDKMIRVVNEMVPMIEGFFGNKADFVLLKCTQNDPKFMFELGSKSWAHLRIIPKENK